MSNFNLEKALAGELVRLRNGNKARIFYRIPDEYTFEDETHTEYPLKGIILNNDNKIVSTNECWRDDGTYGSPNNDKDIVCMFDSLEDIIDKAYKDKLPVKLRNGDKAVIFSKIPDKYIYSDESKPEYVYRGAILDTNNDNPYLITEVLSWLKNGHYLLNSEHDNDIIGIWED